MLALVLGITIVLIAVTEVMFRVGRRMRPKFDEPSRDQVSTLQAATLGLLALMLGFTMAMAENRYAVRRATKVAEANAVRSAYMRADLLPEPERSETRELMIDYVEARRAYFSASTEEAVHLTERAMAISAQMWKRAMSAARAHPDWDVLVAYVEALDEAIGLEATRDFTLRARLPSMILALLVVIAVVAIGVTGYTTGVAGARNAFALYLMPLLVAFMCTVIVDIDRSRFGLIHAGDAPMLRVQDMITRS